MPSPAGKRYCKGPARERGQVLLELIPVMTLMLTLIFAVIDFSRAIWQLQVLTSLSREGSNLASRNTSLQVTANALISDGSILNLSTNGKVIITSVENQANNQNAQPKFVMTGQYSAGNLSVQSNLGTYDSKKGSGANKVSLPSTTTTIPPPGGTVYVTEIYSSYSPITPLGAFVKIAVPSTLYDIAYF